MAIIAIKSAKPFIEKLVQGKGVKDNIKVGVRLYKDSELKPIRSAYLKNLDNSHIARWGTKLKALTENSSLTDDAFDAESARLTTAISDGNEALLGYQVKFIKENVQYIKNASLEIDGKDLLIADTREAKPIESLWNTPDECLAVLLDMYLDSPFFKDSLSTAVSNAVFGTDVKGEELGN